MSIEAIDIFCGIGGLTYGLDRSGIKVVAGLDNDEFCRYSYEQNNKCQFISSDLRNYDLRKLKSHFSSQSKKILVGCAPCQPFSSHTFKAKNNTNDARWNLIDYFLKAVEIVKPDVVSMENVRGIVSTEIFQCFLRNIMGMGYSFDYKIVYCPDYGIPQARYRLVFLASKKTGIMVPAPTHSRDEYVTVERAIGNLPEIRSGEVCVDDPLHRARKLSPLNMERLKQSEPGGSWKDWDNALLPDCYRRASGQSYTSVYGRMEEHKVSPTITTQYYNYGSGRFGHPHQHRALSLREGAILQTFPHDYDFGEKITYQKIGQFIGNAVPPTLAMAIGNSICKHLEG